VRGVDGFAHRVREHQLIAFDCQAFGLLSLSVALKRFYGQVRQPDTTAAPGGFRSLEGLLSVARDECALYVQNATR
jgi:hypothetical protein